MVDVALEAAKKGGTLAYRLFKTSPRVSYKKDNTPVTRADLETEKLMRKIISKKFPDHGIVGEELGTINPAAKYQWVLDPIDGTKHFVRQLPFWATLLAVLEDKRPIIGIAYYPALAETFVAQLDRGTYFNGKKTKVSRRSQVKRAFVTYGSVNNFAKIGRVEGLVKLCQSVESRAGFGSYNYGLLLKGQVDVVVDPLGAIYDYAAPSILVQEAGGKFSDFDGKPSINSGNLLATNGLLHKKILKILNS